MLQTEKQKRSATRSKLHVGLASCPSEVREAQKLRYRVFAEELGARLQNRIAGVDHDVFDSFCEHLVVRDEGQSRIVGTYRILSPHAALCVGGYYSETEFDLSRLEHLRPRIVEIGRSCIDPEYRTGAAIALLWSALARYMRENGHDYLLGCASLSMSDGGHTAASIYTRLRERHASPPEYRVFPRCALPLAALRRDLPAAVPPLVKGYLRAGAWICGEPAWDPDFNTADLPILMPMNRLDPKYERHFMPA